MRPTRICVVCPCFNEAEVLDRFYARLKGALTALGEVYEHRIIFVDDGSHDGTSQIISRLARQDSTVRGYSLSRNFGHQAALSAGLDMSRGDAVILMDSDLQHPPELIPRFVEVWQAGNDIVLAVRQRTQSVSWFKRWSSEGFYWVFNRLSDTQLVPGVADFGLLSRRAHRELRRLPERHRFLRGMISWLGFSKAYISYEAAERAAGKSKYSLGKMFALALDGAFSFSAKPLRWAAKLGFVSLLAGLSYLLCLFVGWTAGRTVVGSATILGASLVLGGVQMVFMGMIGEYLGRVCDEVKRRPHYVISRRMAQRRPNRTRVVRRERLTQAA